jgi:hypothetical protein
VGGDGFVVWVCLEVRLLRRLIGCEWSGEILRCVGERVLNGVAWNGKCRPRVCPFLFLSFLALDSVPIICISRRIAS